MEREISEICKGMDIERFSALMSATSVEVVFTAVAWNANPCEENMGSPPLPISNPIKGSFN